MTTPLYSFTKSCDPSLENREAGYAGLTIDIPPEQGLAMKADLALPWNKLRVVRRLILTINHYTYINLHNERTKMCINRWLSSSGISLSSERKLAKEQVGDNLDAETAPFSFNLASGGEELMHMFLFLTLLRM